MMTPFHLANGVVREQWQRGRRDCCTFVEKRRRQNRLVRLIPDERQVGVGYFMRSTGLGRLKRCRRIGFTSCFDVIHWGRWHRAISIVACQRIDGGGLRAAGRNRGYGIDVRCIRFDLVHILAGSDDGPLRLLLFDWLACHCYRCILRGWRWLESQLCAGVHRATQPEQSQNYQYIRQK